MSVKKHYKHFLAPEVRIGFGKIYNHTKPEDKNLSYVTAIEYTKTGIKKYRSDIHHSLIGLIKNEIL